MTIREIIQFARTAGTIRNYLKKTLTVEQAINDIKIRMDNREKNFLSLVEQSVYQNKSSPYRKLLSLAGCDFADLQQSVIRQGLEKTLQKLRDEGVYITLEEFKSKIPISRKGLTIETSENNFDNPLVEGKGFQCTSSGSRSRGTVVILDWDFIAAEAANELLLYEIHGLADAPLAFWLPVLPCISGVHNFLMNIKSHRTPQVWFSQLATAGPGLSRKNRLIMNNILSCCRFFGVPAPKPEFVDIDNAEPVAQWMEKTNRARGVCVLRTYASSAVRAVQAAMDKGLDISGSVIFTGAEPLTEKRTAFIKSAGAKPFSRYVATETGLIGASCANATCPDDMHIYLDRLAVIQRTCQTASGHNVDSFLFTTLLENTGKILINTDLGDFGILSSQPCGCLFGQLNMNLRVCNVRSYDKLTCEGMTLLGSQLDDTVGEVIEDAGGSPDDYQFWETQDDSGLAKLVVAVSPRLGQLNETSFTNAILDKLRSKNITITSQIWQQAKVLRLVRQQPEMTKGFKLLRIKKQPQSRT
jgi:hypothetical protein